MMEFSFEKLEVWKDAMGLAEMIYKMTKNIPEEEKYGIVSQIQRAAVSVSVNIAEGRGRHHVKEQIQFFYTSRGSLYEVITLLKLCLSLEFIDQNKYEKVIAKCESILSKLSGLINSLKET
ncbi:MAG: four helix bundle protein [Candidatus Poribacteria bacterium]